MKIDRYLLLKILIAPAVVASTIIGLHRSNPPTQDIRIKIEEAAARQVQALSSSVEGDLPLIVIEPKDWRAVYAVDIGGFCESSPSNSIAKSYSTGLSQRPLPTLTGDYTAADVKPIAKPFMGVAILLQPRDHQEVTGERPFGVWWLVHMTADRASALRQEAANGKLNNLSLHFDAQMPLVPVAWAQTAGYAIFAAVTPLNIENDLLTQVVASDRVDSPAFYAGTTNERYQAAYRHWRAESNDKQREWDAIADELRAKVEAAKSKPQAEWEAVRTEVSEAASKAKAEKDAWLKAHPEPKPSESAS